MPLQKYLQPRCFERPKYGTPTPVVLSATGLLKPCNYYASSHHMRDLITWAEENNLDWENDLSVANGLDKVYASETWQKLIQELTRCTEQSSLNNIPLTCVGECTQKHIANDE